MKRGRKEIPSYKLPVPLRIILKPQPEPSIEFEKRAKEVKDMIAKVILIANKRGRPSQKDDEYEEAA
ncbi:hypothetical protein DOM22_05725 [Bdellovibrio sp. ZAP7]|uniref:hypothetical protein n=1 Tax=Bdellovibrio sp. ZAP7 TaxID=2231053 RepID=UPI00115AFDCC|nr:hypothetical protein [Bdellovibrio sp. ZAP7]QDK44696.1 hypothetical protein DOM22_05725 [Bdellovibrio sp. ZAP7]